MHLDLEIASPAVLCVENICIYYIILYFVPVEMFFSCQSDLLFYIVDIILYLRSVIIISVHHHKFLHERIFQTENALHLKSNTKTCCFFKLQFLKLQSSDSSFYYNDVQVSTYVSTGSIRQQ